MPLGVIMSKKNIKNNKKNSTRKNYKIEALEPRLMMSAESSLIDLEQQIESVSDNVDNYVNSISSLQLSDAGFDSSLDSALEPTLT